MLEQLSNFWKMQHLYLYGHSQSSTVKVAHIMSWYAISYWHCWLDNVKQSRSYTYITTCLPFWWLSMSPKCDKNICLWSQNDIPSASQNDSPNTIILWSQEYSSQNIYRHKLAPRWDDLICIVNVFLLKTLDNFRDTCLLTKIHTKGTGQSNAAPWSLLQRHG